MQLVQQVGGKMYVRKNQRRKKMVIVMFVQSLLLRELKISEATLTLSRQRPLSYRNQSIDLPSKSMDWFLYDNGLRHKRVKNERSEICGRQPLKNLK